MQRRLLICFLVARGVKKLERSLWAMKNELDHLIESENWVENASEVGQSGQN